MSEPWARVPGDGDLVCWALGRQDVIARFRALVWPAPVLRGDRLWVGALSSGGHGRFWIGRGHDGRGHVVIAHRFAWALAHGASELDGTVVAHRCDEASCQNPEHLVAGSWSANTVDWWARRGIPRTPLRDVRGAAVRARALRAALLGGQNIDAVASAGLGGDLDQPTLI